ncbi:MAG TPA: TorF family putative porin [Thermoanaerobaculia bacterium]|nr:TorF family putative porin [Thermoanaerobaculia bacterium]
MHRISGPRTAWLLLVVLALSAPAAAEVTATYALDFASAYVWRGITVTDGGVFQPSITIAHDGGFAFNTWGNLDITDDNDLSGQFHEIDLVPSYTFPSDGRFTATIGLIEYLFPNTGGGHGTESTREAFLSLGWSGTVSPVLAIYYDFDQVDDIYANFGISFSNEIATDTTWRLALTAGYAGEDFASSYVGGTESGLFDGRATLTLAYAPDGKWGIAGYVAYSDSLDDDVLPEQEVDFFGGISFSRSF